MRRKIAAGIVFSRFAFVYPIKDAEEFSELTDRKPLFYESTFPKPRIIIIQI